MTQYLISPGKSLSKELPIETLEELFPYRYLSFADIPRPGDWVNHGGHIWEISRVIWHTDEDYIEIIVERTT